MNLDQLIGHLVNKLTCSRFRQGDTFGDIVGTFIDGHQRGFNARARQFLLRKQISGPMPQCLERANNLAKLNPGFQVIECHIKCLRAGAQHLGGEASTGAIKNRVKQLKARIQRAEHCL